MFKDNQLIHMVQIETKPLPLPSPPTSGPYPLERFGDTDALEKSRIGVMIEEISIHTRVGIEKLYINTVFFRCLIYVYIRNE